MKYPPLSLEFAPKAPRLSQADLAMVLGAALVLAATTVYLIVLLLNQQDQRRELEQAFASGRKPAFTATRTPKKNSADLALVSAAQQTSRSLTTPWPELMLALESTPKDVALLSVDPSAARHSVSLTVEAASTAHMLQYLRQLQTNPKLSDVALVSHELQEKAAGVPVRFQVRASWGVTP